MTDFNMLNILKKFKSVDKTLTESTITECGGMPAAPSTPVTVNLSAGSAGEMAAILKALSNIDSGTSMPVPAPAPAPADMGMSKLKSIVSNSDMGADAAYSDVIKDEEDLDEAINPKELMGQIRKMAKGVETSHDDREHRIFASQVESDLIDLFQYFNQVQRDTEKQEIVRNLIRQNKKAQQQTDLRNANNIVSVLWDLMNANEEFVNEPDEEYQDHDFMIKALSGGINRQKQMFKPAAKGDNPMAVETIKDRLLKALAEAKKSKKDYDGDGKVEKPSDEWKGSRDKAIKKAVADKKKKAPVKEGAAPYAPVYLQYLKQQFGDKKVLDRSDKYKIADIIKKSSIEHLKQLALANIPHVSNAAKNYIKHKTPGGMVRPLETNSNEARSLDQMDPIRQEVFYFLRDIYDRLEAEQDADVTDDIVDEFGDMRSEVMRSGDKLLISHYKAVRMAAGDNDALYDAINAALHDLVEEDDSPKQEAEFQAPTHELSDTSRKAMNIAQMIKRKINSGEQMDDRDYNQMAELGAILSRFGTSFGPKTMKDVMAHMVQYTNDRNEEGHGYPEFNVDRFKELMAMAKSTGESMVGEISSDLAKRYTKAAKMDRDFNDDDINRLSKSGQSTQAMHRRNAKRTQGINRAKKRM
jgi:hypothetical protein